MRGALIPQTPPEAASRHNCCILICIICTAHSAEVQLWDNSLPTADMPPRCCSIKPIS